MRRLRALLGLLSAITAHVFGNAEEERVTEARLQAAEAEFRSAYGLPSR